MRERLVAGYEAEIGAALWRLEDARRSPGRHTGILQRLFLAGIYGLQFVRIPE
jgi:hypothetical protein